MSYTARDWEAGRRPTCNACGCELDPETDCHHDGYRGSEHAHNGRGSTGLSAKHFVFGALCERCSESRTAPLRAILDYDRSTELLECGHTHATPHNRFGGIRSGNRRKCEKCRTCAPINFDPARLGKQLSLRAKVRGNLAAPIVARHSTRENWDKLAMSLLEQHGAERPDSVPYPASWFGVAELRRWAAAEVREQNELGALPM